MHFLRIIYILIFLLFINVVTIMLGDDESKLTVVNSTAFYLHLFVDGTEYLYVAPTQSITHATDPKPDMIVTALYAPGQGLKGSITDTVDVPYQSAFSGCSCEEGQSDCSYTPPAGGSTRWEVTPDMIDTEIID